MSLPDRVDQPPETYLATVGEILARFDQQDSGNVSYGVRVDGVRYFVKTAGNPADNRPWLAHRQRVELLRNAARLGRTYRHPTLPRLHRVTETPEGPMLVFDWADGELIGAHRDRREDPESAFQRFRRLPVPQLAAALDAVFDLHRLLGDGGEVAGDFYDGCLLYDFRTGRLRIIDLDGYRNGPYRNEMGRMFGSTRFMAPEEFTKGAVIDQRTTVFTLGRALLVFLSDGTTTAAAFRGPRPLYEVAIRACQERPDRRYGSVGEFYTAWRSAAGAAESSAVPPAA